MFDKEPAIVMVGADRDLPMRTGQHIHVPICRQPFPASTAMLCPYKSDLSYPHINNSSGKFPNR